METPRIFMASMYEQQDGYKKNIKADIKTAQRDLQIHVTTESGSEKLFTGDSHSETIQGTFHIQYMDSQEIDVVGDDGKIPSKKIKYDENFPKDCTQHKPQWEDSYLADDFSLDLSSPLSFHGDFSIFNDSFENNFKYLFHD
eukprot:gene4176-6522_t